MLLSIKKNRIINLIVRTIIKRCAIISSNLFLFIMNRWTVSGVVKCNFHEHRFKYFNNCDDGILNYFYYNLPYNEDADLKLFIELSKKSKTIVDIGANTGIYSVLASIANPSSKIFAFEPYLTNAERMQINLNLNAADNVEVVVSAIGDTNGLIDIAIPENKTITDVSSINQAFSKSIYPEIAWGKQEVEIQKLDTFAENRNLKIDLIKCDVETSEMLVFRGMINILERDKPTIIFESFFNDERQLFFNEVLKDFNYYLYLILDQGVVYCKEGFVPQNRSLNYLISPVIPTQTYIDFKDIDDLCNGLLMKPKVNLIST